ncbi:MULTISPECIES: TIGR04211 family SH3 domain-containing protein [Thioalkalivibrio]|uniref:Ligand-binding protein SH3 n=1 Tax=Thioalkalivibrio halophilus TaxID=252474 RepID=A0A1V3A050_9GAMM|nr:MULTISPECIES: TIGR04211 family SH3 domain-containing protein [Thioalkalivibrio]OOC10737.1 ligand-binding protein SH3 [Thioalkalivibrio halophilus]PYG04464.1 SH3 domain protein [Thioalkalivibrio sp. ALE21]
MVRRLQIRNGLVVLSLAGALMVAGTAPAAAQTRYVSDSLETAVYSSPQGGRIVSSVDAGDQVQVLEDDGGYSRIRLPSGNEAWILTRYLQDEPHARERLAEVEEELAEIRSGADDQEGRIAELLDERNALQREVEEQSERMAGMQEELEELRDIAERPQEIQRRNERLEEELLETREAAEDYRRQVEVMRADSDRRWFMTGAAVAVGSAILGIILTRLPTRRRRSDWLN